LNRHDPRSPSSEIVFLRFLQTSPVPDNQPAAKRAGGASNVNQRFSDQSLSSLAAVAFGSASICLLSLLGSLSSPSHETIFHLDGSASAVFVPALLDVALLSLLLCGLLTAVRGVPWMRRTVWSGLIVFLPLVAVRQVCYLMDIFFSHPAKIAWFWVCCGLTAVLALFVSGPVFERIRRVFHAVLAILAVPAALLSVQTACFGFEARHLNESHRPVALAQAGPQPVVRLARARPRGRVIWIVLDELAHRQLFLHRPRSLDLPEFDRWRATSTLFTEVVPAALYTRVALPSLLLGRPLEGVSATADGQLRVLDGDGRVGPFREQDTVFEDADSLGYRTAVAGWYIPYCRMLPTVVQSCFWSSQAAVSGISPGQTVESNLLMPLWRLWDQVPAFVAGSSAVTRSDLADGERHVEDFERLNDASDRLLEAGQYNFVLLHMPIPHPAGIYDRTRKVYAVDRSCYVDNLALADTYLAHVRQVLEQRREWDDATVLVMGDHAWRTTLMWSHTRPWSAEDAEASEGDDDDNRPAYLVKLPHQHRAATVETEFHAVRTRALVDELMEGRIESPEQLQSWADELP
jgi:hypothetical protein